ALEDDPFGQAQVALFGESLDRRLDVARAHRLGVERQRGTLFTDGGELLVADIYGNYDAAHRSRDLRAIAADATNAVDDDQIALADTRLHNRLIGRGNSVSDHRQIGEIDAGRLQAMLVDDAQPARRHDDVGGEAAVNIVARHLLMRADGGLAAQAGVAAAAGDNRRHNHRAVGVPEFVGAGLDDMAADLVAEAERQLVLGAHAVVVVAEVGVADAATSDL